ncbi:MAG: hypothetical protein KZQ89_18970 [Candidatus Thiodiazotropha sp. (ex Lucinoma kastoroae)]|nr:hypothetical protein [Candidatus Thiodiazotropha sp. (ex Lucinoma kastoroae)]
MTTDKKPPMFGPSAVIDLTSEPRSEKSALMNVLIEEYAGKPKAFAETIIDNCTTTIPMKFDFNNHEIGHTFVIAPTSMGMTADQKYKKQ